LNNPAEQPVTLPTGTLLIVATACSVLAASGWAAGCFTLGKDTAFAMSGVVGALVVGACSIAAILLMQPWNPKPLYRWPMVWIACSMGRLLATLALGLLLYSATPFGTRSLWMGIVVAYAVTLVGETRVYASHMKRFSPSATLPRPESTRSSF